MTKSSWQTDPSDILPDDPAYSLSNHLRHVEKQWRSYPLNNKQAAEKHLVSILRPAFKDRYPDMIAGELCDCIEAIYDRDIIETSAPTLQYRPYLERMQARLNTHTIAEADKATTAFLSQLLPILPPGAFEKARDLSKETWLSLYEFIPHPKWLPTLVVRCFGVKVADLDVFPGLHDALIENIIRASGFDPKTYDGKRRLTFSEDAEGTTEEILERYLIGTPFLRLFIDPVPFKIPTSVFRAHGIIIAPPEHGKTQLFSSFIRRFLDEDIGMAVLDPHGDLFESLKGRTPPERTIILDPSSDPPPLNIFDFKDASPTQVMMTFFYLMSSLAGGLTDKQAGIAPYLLKLIRVIPNATLQTLLDIMRERPIKDEPSRYLPYVEKLDPDDANFFKLQFLGNKMVETKDAFAWKLSAAMGSDAFKAMFAAPINSFDAFKAMQERKIILVKGSENTLGQYGLPVFMQLIVAQFFLAALKRQSIPEDQRSTFLIFADEAAHIFNSQTTRILTECRKYGLGFLAATQLIKLIPPDVLAAIYGATAIKISGPVQANDAVALAREMHTTHEQLRSLKPGQTAAEWMVWHKGLSQAVKLRVPHGALNDLPFRGLPPMLTPRQPAPQPPPNPSPVSSPQSSPGPTIKWNPLE